MKRKLFCAALALTLCVGSLPAAAAGETFPVLRDYPGFVDVREDTWYADTVALCYEIGLMNGKPGGFDPMGTMTLPEAAAIAARIREALTGQTIPAQGAGEAWYQRYVDYLLPAAQQAGGTYLVQLLQSLPESPEAPATRLDFVSMLDLAAPDGTLAPINSITYLPDTDLPGVLRLYNAGILTGVDGYGTFSPTGTLSRAECAAMAARMARPELREKFTPKEASGAAFCLDKAYGEAGISRDTVLLTVDGAGVTAEEYLYWVVKSARRLSEDGDQSFWDDQDLVGILRADALDSAVLYQTVENQAAALGLSMTAEDQADYISDVSEITSLLGQQGLDLEAYLGMLGITPRCFDTINQAAYLYANIKDALFSPGGRLAPTDQELDDWAQEQGILRAKHILLKTTPDEDPAITLNLAQDIREELAEGGDTEALFDELVERYGQDEGMKAEPDGYTFGPGYMILPFEEGTKALALGEISQPVRSEFGYHIILRLPPDREYVRADYLAQAGDELIHQWVDEAKVVTTPAYDSLDIQRFCLALDAAVAELGY